MASPQNEDGYISIPSLVSLQACPRLGNPSSQKYSGPASQIRTRYRKSYFSSRKGIWHLQHPRRVEDGHPTRSSPTIATPTYYDITRKLSTCCRHIYNGGIYRSVSLSLKALEDSKRRRITRMCTFVHVAVLIAAHFGTVAADNAVFLRRYTQYHLLSLHDFCRTGDFPSLRRSIVC
jgi:hypothetical protein